MHMKQKDTPLIHRDISWLSFNYRVLQEAKDPSVPLFEKIKFLGIYSSNLDEFFRVRVASHKSLIRLSKKTKQRLSYSPEKLIKEIREIVTQQQIEFGEIYKRQIIPQLQACNIWMIAPHQLTKDHISYIDKLFEEKLIQYLQPVLIVQNKIKTFLRSNVLYLAVKLNTNGSNNRYAVIEIPTNKIPRFVVLPSEDEGKKELIYLDDIVRTVLPKLFPGYNVVEAHSIKVTRDADIYIDDEYSGDLIEKIRKGIEKRHIGTGTRFVSDRKMPKSTLNFLMKALSIKEYDLQKEGRYHNNFDFFKFPNFGLKHLKDSPQQALSHPAFHQKVDLFKIVEQKDRLLHFPYQKYDYVIRLLEQAAIDPEVNAIKIIQYRVAKDSQVIAALRRAIQEGKEVVVFVEVKARFDEEANLYWAARLEEWGAKVIYSFPALKVHAKLLLIERKGQSNICYLGTGNFNEDTSTIYSDFGMMTKHKGICAEIAEVFHYLEIGKKPSRPFKHILVGQFRMRRNIYDLIENEIKNAQEGKPAEIILKLNSIQDKRMIARLYKASEKGVKIKMIIRGICSVIPGLPKYSENIEIISIIDRYLEHTRMYHFHNNGNEQIFLSSADWMTRNLYYRIECAFPVYDADLKAEINDFIRIQWADNIKSRIIDEEQSNRYKRNLIDAPYRSQQKLYEYYQDKLLQKSDKKNKG